MLVYNSPLFPKNPACRGCRVEDVMADLTDFNLPRQGLLDLKSRLNDLRGYL
jgi:hypothetical protein